MIRNVFCKAFQCLDTKFVTKRYTNLLFSMLKKSPMWPNGIAFSSSLLNLLHLVHSVIMEFSTNLRRPKTLTKKNILQNIADLTLRNYRRLAHLISWNGACNLSMISKNIMRASNLKMPMFILNFSEIHRFAVGLRFKPWGANLMAGQPFRPCGHGSFQRSLGSLHNSLHTLTNQQIITYIQSEKIWKNWVSPAARRAKSQHFEDP